MHAYRNSPAVICHGAGTILLQIHFDLAAEACQMLIHGVVHDLVDQMVQSFGRNTSDVHTGTFPNCFQSLQDRDTVRIIGAAFRHNFLLLYNTAEPQKDSDLRQLLLLITFYSLLHSEPHSQNRLYEAFSVSLRSSLSRCPPDI